MMKINPPIIPRNTVPRMERISHKKDERGALQILDDMQRKLDAAMGAEIDLMKAAAESLQGPIKPRTGAEVEANYIKRNLQK